VAQKNNRWLINTFLVVTIVGFLGFSFFPLLENILPRFKSSAASTVPSPQVSSPNNVDLAAQAKGYELVLQREPDNSTALRGLLEIRLQQGDLKGAIIPLEKLVQVKNEESDYAVLLAQARQQIGDNDAAIQTYRQILVTKPGNMNALQGLAGLYLQQKRPLAAVGLLQDTLKVAEVTNQAQANAIDIRAVKLLLGQVYANQKQYDRAIALYDDLVTGDNKDFRPILAKAVILQEQGRNSQAKPLFDQASNLAPAQYKDQIQQLATSKSEGGTEPKAADPAKPDPANTVSPNVAK
jgi:tetratricopeptide (TPR) repeat protein